MEILVLFESLFHALSDDTKATENAFGMLNFFLSEYFSVKILNKLILFQIKGYSRV
jgi:hypothetical protein